ncbi:MAG: PD-(D/E)XK nuclease family protein [Bacteroidales bacterium]|nr:PD-(D/E)XK nuclease family protein [Bacteroidales bacterium]
MDTIQSLLNKIGTIRKHYFEIESLSGENFNIFKVIGLTTEEVRLHSAFLTELLNPKGSHGQKEVFLKLFVSQFEIKNFDCKSAFVKAEYYIGEKTGVGIDAKGGRIDIYIKDKYNNDIIIENKIYAGDQEDQLVRYCNYSKKNVYYLTLDGKDAEDFSKRGLKIDKDYHTISYKEDIILWLETCKKESVNQPLLREGIGHYINLIKHLTDQSTNKAMSNEIINEILMSKEALSSSRVISNNFTKAKQELQIRFWDALIIALEINKDLKIEKSEGLKDRLVGHIENFYKRNSQRDKNYGLEICVHLENDLSIFWKCSIYDSVSSRFILKKGEKPERQDNSDYDEYRRLVKICDENYIPNEWSLGKQYTNPQLNFMAFDSPEIFNLADDNNLKEIVKGIAKKAFQDIEKLKGLLNNKPIE